jgi:hypothetical protein
MGSVVLAAYNEAVQKGTYHERHIRLRSTSLVFPQQPAHRRGILPHTVGHWFEELPARAAPRSTPLPLSSDCSRTSANRRRCCSAATKTPPFVEPSTIIATASPPARVTIASLNYNIPLSSPAAVAVPRQITCISASSSRDQLPRDLHTAYSTFDPCAAVSTPSLST